MKGSFDKMGMGGLSLRADSGNAGTRFFPELFILAKNCGKIKYRQTKNAIF